MTGSRKTALAFRATYPPPDVGQVGNLRATQRVPRLTAAVPCQRGSWPIANRPQLIKLPHKASAHPRARSVFHGISRAEGPFKQTKQTDRLSHFRALPLD